MERSWRALSIFPVRLEGEEQLADIPQEDIWFLNGLIRSTNNPQVGVATIAGGRMPPLFAVQGRQEKEKRHGDLFSRAQRHGSG